MRFCFSSLAIPIVSAFVIAAGCGGSAPPAATSAPDPSTPPAAAPAGNTSLAAPSELAQASFPADAGAPSTLADAAPPPVDAAVAASEPAGAHAEATDGGASSFNYDLVDGIYRAHKDSLRKACAPGAKAPDAAFAGSVTVRVAPTGKVLSSKTTGSDAAQAACIDAQIKGWAFPPPKGTATITLPLHFRW